MNLIRRAVSALRKVSGPEIRKSCQLDGKSYAHGTEIVNGAQILECVDGEWRERVNPFITVGP